MSGRREEEQRLPAGGHGHQRVAEHGVLALDGLSDNRATVTVGGCRMRHRAPGREETEGGPDSTDMLIELSGEIRLEL